MYHQGFVTPEVKEVTNSLILQANVSMINKGVRELLL